MLLALLLLFQHIPLQAPINDGAVRIQTAPTIITTPLTVFSFQIPIPQGCVAFLSDAVVTITCTTTVIPPPPALTLTTPVILPAATVGKPYATSLATLAAPKGGVAPYTYSATGLPPGLTLSSTGTLSGTPTTKGSYTISFTVTDSSGVSTNATFTISPANNTDAIYVPITY